MDYHNEGTKYLNIKESAEYLGVARCTIYRWIESQTVDKPMSVAGHSVYPVEYLALLKDKA